MIFYVSYWGWIELYSYEYLSFAKMLQCQSWSDVGRNGEIIWKRIIISKSKQHPTCLRGLRVSIYIIHTATGSSSIVCEKETAHSLDGRHFFDEGFAIVDSWHRGTIRSSLRRKRPIIASSVRISVLLLIRSRRSIGSASVSLSCISPNLLRSCVNMDCTGKTLVLVRHFWLPMPPLA